MIKVTFEFASKEEAAAFLGAGAVPVKAVRQKKEKKEDPLDDDLGADDEPAEEDDADFDLEDSGIPAAKTLKQQIQERAAQLAAADKKEAVTTLLKKIKEKNPTLNIKGLSSIPEKLEAKFLELLNKIVI